MGETNGQPGIGMMLCMLGGNANSVKAWKAAKGKTIKSLVLDPQQNDGDGGLVFEFEDGSGLMLYDGARSCCESRYMATEDDLAYHVGARLLDAEVKEGPEEEREYGEVRETAFLHVTTSKGVFVVNTYNEHNGYYGGIAIFAKAMTP